MSWQFTPYAALLFLTALAVIGIAAMLRRYRKTPGAVALGVMLAAAGVWDLGAGLELSATELPAKLLWAKSQYFGIVTIPVAWLAFSLQYTNRESWLSRRKVLLLSLPSIAALALALTSGYHGLIWPATELVRDGGVWDLRLEHGPAFWGFWAYSYVLLLAGTVFLVSALLRSSRLYRMQGMVLLLGVAAPWIGNALYVSGLSPLGGRDVTPLAFLVCGAAMAWGVTKFRLLDMMPVARHAVFDHMNDGVVVLDPRDRVVDMNLAARRVLGFGGTEITGLKAEDVLGEILPLLESETGYREVSVGEGEGRREYSLESSDVLDRRGDRRCVILNLRDVTEERRAQEALERSERRYRAVVEQAAEGIFLCDFETRYVLESNGAFRRLLGYTEAELSRMRLYDLIEHDPASVDANIQLVAEMYEATLGERRYRRKDGSLVDVEVSASHISYGDREGLCVVLRDVTSRRMMDLRLKHLASHDPLTDLPNRPTFMERLREALASGEAAASKVGVLFLDLDGFKQVNDHFGHDYGDRLLVETASRIKSCLRPGDCAARLGGDEFTVLLESVSGVEQAADVARRIETRVKEPFVIEGRAVQVGVSIGVVASGGSATAENAEGLLHNADLAMYGTKRDGRSSVQTFVSGPRRAGSVFYLASAAEPGAPEGERHADTPN